MLGVNENPPKYSSQALGRRILKTTLLALVFGPLAACNKQVLDFGGFNISERLTLLKPL